MKACQFLNALGRIIRSIAVAGGLIVAAISLNSCSGPVNKRRVVVIVVDSGVNSSYVGGTVEGDEEVEIRHGSAMAKIIRERSERCVIHSISIGEELDSSGGSPRPRLSTGGYLKALRRALMYMKNHPNDAFVLNLSLGSPNPLTEEHDSIRELHRAGAVIIAAVANANTENPTYPAAYEEVVAVTNATRYGKVPDAGWGNYIALAAPGSEILNYLNMVARVPGTSCSCAFISGLAAELLIKEETLGPVAAIQIIQRTADPIPDEIYKKGLLGSGVVNIGSAYKALRGLQGNAGREDEQVRLWIHGIFILGIILLLVSKADDLQGIRIKNASTLSLSEFSDKIVPIVRAFIWSGTYLVTVGVAIWMGQRSLWVIPAGFVACYFVTELSLPIRQRIGIAMSSRRVPRVEEQEISMIASQIMQKSGESCLSIDVFRFLAGKLTEKRFWLKEEKRISDLAHGFLCKREDELLSFLIHLTPDATQPDPMTLSPLLSEVISNLDRRAIPALANIFSCNINRNKVICRDTVSMLVNFGPQAIVTLRRLAELAGSRAGEFGLDMYLPQEETPRFNPSDSGSFYQA